MGGSAPPGGIHERRTGDKDAAQSMLAIKPSSFSSDVAPSWLVTEAASYSQSEHKRRERAQAGGHGGGNSNGGEPKAGEGKGTRRRVAAGPDRRAALVKRRDLRGRVSFSPRRFDA